MDMRHVNADFKEFLKLLEDEGVEYLLIGGYAVALYGYCRTTADMDVWVAVAPENAQKLVSVFREFGMDTPEVIPELFLEEGNIIRMGVPPVRIEVQTKVSGVQFDDCYERRRRANLEGFQVNVIGLDDLKTNKRAAGRDKDLDDLANLP